MFDNVDVEDDDIKVILVGEAGTGKTNLINTCIGLKFNPNKESTLTSTFSPKTFTINNIKYNLNLWDTVGQEEYRSLNRIFMKDSKIVILVYSISVKKTFNELDYWYNIAKDNLGDEPVIGVVGNKKDLYLEEEVTEDEGKKYAAAKNIKFKLVSAKDNPDEFAEFLKNLLEDYLAKNPEKRKKNIKLDDDNKKDEKKKKCC